MNLRFEHFDVLPLDAKNIRETVFVKEQGFNEEFDISDKKAIHILMYLDDTPIGTARIIYSNKHNAYTIGRVAILKEYRHNHYGKKLMKYTEKIIVQKYGHIQIGVSSQERVSVFYSKLGYSETKERYLDENCPHVWMIKSL